MRDRLFVILRGYINLLKNLISILECCCISRMRFVRKKKKYCISFYVIDKNYKGIWKIYFLMGMDFFRILINLNFVSVCKKIRLRKDWFFFFIFF